MLSISYAVWNDRLSLDATANAGKIQLEIEDVSHEGFSKMNQLSVYTEEIYFDAEMSPEDNGILTIKVINRGSLPVKYWNAAQNKYDTIAPESYGYIIVSISSDFADTDIIYSAIKGSWSKSLHIEGKIQPPAQDDAESLVEESSESEKEDQLHQETPSTEQPMQTEETPQPTETMQPAEPPMNTETTGTDESDQPEKTQQESTSEPTETNNDEMLEPAETTEPGQSTQINEITTKSGEQIESSEVPE